MALPTEPVTLSVPQIEELLRGDTNAIVIVGAAHLVDKEGVVSLIRQKGYRVVQE